MPERGLQCSIFDEQIDRTPFCEDMSGDEIPETVADLLTWALIFAGMAVLGGCVGMWIVL